MSEITPTDELLNRAFQLAYFILGDRTAAIYVAMAAIDKLKTASTIQDRRLYYMPTGRSAYPAARTKVSLSHIHLLQRLIYTESEPFERLIEGQEKPLQQQDMIIRFIKHLVRVATKHNSFYVALGLSRLLYNYTTSETTEIYNLVIQDPDRGRDDYYYRSRKMHLLKELKDRFRNSLKTYRGFRGEERFQPQEDSAIYLSLVKECLSRFTPWESVCVLPPDVDPTKNIVTSLLFNGKDPDEEHEIELNRLHTLLHPDCFERLVLALGLDPPAQRLELPYFFISSNAPGATDDRFKPQALSRGELDAIRRYLEKNSTYRKDASKQLLSVLVDGDEYSCFAIDQTSSVQINVEEYAEFIEVRSLEEDEEVPLAIYPLTYNESGIITANASIMLGQGQRLSITVQPSDGSSGETAAARVSITYQEARPITRVSSLLQQFKLYLSSVTGLWQQSSVNYLKLLLGFLFIAICITGVFIYLQSRNASPDQQLIAEQKEDRGQDNQNDQPSAPVPSPPPRDQRGHKQTTPPLSSSGDTEATRGRKPGLDSAVLIEVKRVYVDPLGNELLSEQARQMLIDNLQSSNRFIVVETRGEADAVFKGSAKRVTKGGEKVSIALRLVNARGQVIWSRTYSGYVVDITDRIVKELLADIQRLEGNR
jgi:hypothetical protein